MADILIKIQYYGELLLITFTILYLTIAIPVVIIRIYEEILLEIEIKRLLKQLKNKPKSLKDSEVKVKIQNIIKNDTL